MKNIIGIDIGGMSLKAGRLAISLIEKYQKNVHLEKDITINTHAQISNKEFINLTIQAIDRLRDQNTIAIGIGCPGPLDSNSGVILESANLPLLKNVELIKQLKTHYKHEVFSQNIFLQNDANCAALGQQYFGHGKRYNTFTVITLGTGLGGGLIIEKKLFSGFKGNGFEVGHIPADFKSILKDMPTFTCGCGNQGCLETIASTKGILNYFHYLSNKQFPEIQDVKTLLGLLKSNDEATSAYIEKVFQLAGKALGKLTATLIQTLNIDAIVFTGGISHAQKYLLPTLTSTANGNCFPQLYERTKIYFTEGNENMGTLGACALAFQRSGEVLSS